MITGTETAHLVPKAPTVGIDARLPVVEAKVAADLNLRDGQVIQATLQANLQSLKLNAWDFRLPLTAAQAEILARWAPQSAEDFKLRVQVMPNGNILLRPVTQNPSATQIATAPTPPAAEAMTALASRAQMLSLRPTDMRAWLAILNPGVLEALLQTALPPDHAVRQKLTASLKLRPGISNISGDKIRSWLRQSGLAAEHALANAKAVSALDFKNALRSLQAELAAEDPASAHKIQQAVDDIESSQLLASQPAASGREWVLSFVMPFRDAQPVLVRFSRGHQGGEQQSPALTVQLHTQTAGDCDVWLQTKIQDLTRIDMMMWTTDPSLAQEARQQAPLLADELGNLGLEVTGMQVIHGVKPSEMPVHTASSEPVLGHLLDLQT